MDSLLLTRLAELSSAEKLPEHDYFFSLADAAVSVLEKEICGFREKGRNGKAGGLLDFSDERSLPLILVPDLHARAYFLQNIMNFVLPSDFLGSEKGFSVIEALDGKLVRLLCVGDILHSELRGRARWLCAQMEFDDGEVTGDFMSDEMKEGLSLLSMLMELKCAFPDFFHVLKGNHENILNENGKGNFSFGKFCSEGEMCRSFMEAFYGEEVTYVVSCFEKALPLVAVFDNCMVSHAEPLRPYSREELVDALSNGDVIRGLTWTANGEAMDGSVWPLLSNFVKKEKLGDARYFAGHRPVRGKYALRQNGRFVQFHNPSAQNVALVYTDRAFDPERHIVSVV